MRIGGFALVEDFGGSLVVDCSRWEDVEKICGESKGIVLERKRK